MRGFRAVRLALVAAWTLQVGATAGNARELHWETVEVDAQLENDGSLTVSERQEFVFTGDWNGGERIFRLSPGQRVKVLGVVRIDPATGAERALRKGSLDEVDNWQMTDSKTLRWRSRRVDDPPFAGTRIDYRIDYRLSGVLVDQGDRQFLLDHDFAFPDRSGAIRSLIARLSLGSDWQARSALPAQWQSGRLEPGASFVVPVELRFTGAEPPVANPALVVPARGVRLGALSTYVVGVLAFAIAWFRRASTVGWFGGDDGPPVDRAWVDEHVFALPPEVIGAMWDNTIGAPEVAAVLARLTAEGKIESKVESVGWWVFKRQNLVLRLLTRRSQLSGYERSLVDALFGGAEETSTETLRKKHAGTGFDPSKYIKSGIEAAMENQPGFGVKLPAPRILPSVMLIATALLLFVIGGIVGPIGVASVLFPFVTLFPFVFLGVLGGLTLGQRTGGIGAPGCVATVALIFLGGAVAFLASRKGIHFLQIVAAVLLVLGFARIIFATATPKVGAEALRRRRDLMRARRWFERELKREHPDFDDSHFPYLLAFGLAPGVDRWFRRFGEAATHGGSFSSAGSSGGGGGGGWTGGGGAFGGAGATASFAAAATAMSSGVPTPGSSGGGGGGGGSSGGGGGGGW